MVSKHETVHKIKEIVQLHHFVFATVNSYLRAKANSISSVSYRTFFLFIQNFIKCGQNTSADGREEWRIS